MHDYTGVRRKVQSADGTAVYVEYVDENGDVDGTETLEPISNYPPGFGVIATYVCECQMEYYSWDDMADHLSIFDPETKLDI